MRLSVKTAMRRRWCEATAAVAAAAVAAAAAAVGLLQKKIYCAAEFLALLI